MSDQALKQTVTQPSDDVGKAKCLRQVADLLQKHYPPLRVRCLDGDSAFESVDQGEQRQGISAVRGVLVDEGVLLVQLECARVKGDPRVPAGVLFSLLGDLDEKCRPVNFSSPARDGTNSLWIEMRVAAATMSFAREAAFVAQLKSLDELANTIQQEIPRSPNDRELEKAYEKFAEYLEPVYPWEGRIADLPPSVSDWAGETLDFIDGGAPVAVECACPVQTQYNLALLARAAAESGRTLGTLKPTAINAKALVEIAEKAPGIVTLPATRIALGTNPYEMSAEVASMLAAMSSSGAPVVFTGNHGQLQTVFGGGQGGTNDPLLPVLRHAPDVDTTTLARFAIRSAGRLSGGLPLSAEANILRTTVESLDGIKEATQKRILQPVVRRTVTLWSKGKATTREAAQRYAATVASANETLSGLTPRPRGGRSEEIQNRFTNVLTDPGLLGYFKENLLAQDAALEQLVLRLEMEALTRPTFQPVRYCAQGTPATGKSESAILLARRLNVPVVNIDAASLPDFYTASAQLLGSGRGIVGSFQQGRLEQASKAHGGAVIEVSDLDHAVPSVRAALADLFLQVLETGEGQSATGAMFSCANLVFAFTMNLPDGMDEAVRKRIGFRDSVSRRQVTADVSEHMKRFLSGAFLSRVGTPVVFEPLDGAALAMIVERAVKAAILSAAGRLNMEIAALVFEDGLGARAIDLLESNVVSSGARGLLEHGRCMASNAFLQFQRECPDFSGKTLRVSFDADGKMRIASM